MIDRDGVIKALEEAISFVDSRGYGGVADIIHDALELIKDNGITPYYHGNNTYVCGNCGEIVGYPYYRISVVDHVAYKYCPACGRRIKWDDN